MDYPTASVVAYAVVVLVALLAMNWYVWHSNIARGRRQWYSNLPRGNGGTGLEAGSMAAAEGSVGDDGHGFKRVA